MTQSREKFLRKRISPNGTVFNGDLDVFGATVNLLGGFTLDHLVLNTGTINIDTEAQGATTGDTLQIRDVSGNSFAWNGSGASPTSSRKSVPPSACSKQPGRRSEDLVRIHHGDIHRA